MTTLLSAHFSLDEFTQSEVASERGIDNTPPESLLSVLKYTAENAELVRDFLGQPMHINSCYRCEALNQAVGGVTGSAHLSGYAIDFTCPDFGSPLWIVKALETSGIRFDQVIEEGTWVHISFAPSMRQEVLLAHFNNGKATYSEGV